MENSQDNKAKNSKMEIFQEELNKITEIFKNVDESKRKLSEGLIENAAFLKAQLWELQQVIKISGSIKVHPDHPGIQKQVPAMKEYKSSLETYSTVIKNLNNILSSDLIQDDEDDLNEFE